MGVWVPMTRADGQPLDQWRRTTRTEPLADERDDQCLCCGNQPRDITADGVRYGPREHDYHMHMNWRTMLPDAGGSTASVITPVHRVSQYRDDS
jgi:hypothetical protein